MSKLRYVILLIGILHISYLIRSLVFNSRRMADFSRISTAHHATHLHSDDSIKFKLHQWINRVKPANSFISIADHKHARSPDDTSITAAAWMHVDSGAVSAASDDYSLRYITEISCLSGRTPVLPWIQYWRSNKCGLLPINSRLPAVKCYVYIDGKYGGPFLSCWRQSCVQRRTFLLKHTSCCHNSR